MSFPDLPTFELIRQAEVSYVRGTVRTELFMTRAECAPRDREDMTALVVAEGYASQYPGVAVEPVDSELGTAFRVSAGLETELGLVRDEYLIVEGPQSIMVLQTAGTEPRYPTREVRNLLASLRPAGTPGPEDLYEVPVAEPRYPTDPPAAAAAAVPDVQAHNGLAGEMSRAKAVDRCFMPFAKLQGLQEGAAGLITRQSVADASVEHHGRRRIRLVQRPLIDIVEDMTTRAE